MKVGLKKLETWALPVGGNGIILRLLVLSQYRVWRTYGRTRRLCLYLASI